MPGAGPTAQSAARIVSPLGKVAPPTITSASPAPTRHAPNVSGCSSAARAAASVGNLSGRDRKSTRLNSSHLVISYAVFCLKKKKNIMKKLVTASPYTEEVAD